MNKYSTVVGMDLSDTKANFCTMDGASSEILEEGILTLSKPAVLKKFANFVDTLIVFETGTHSPWLQEALEKQGHAVLVANAHKIHLISGNERKHDRHDAQLLARLACADVDFLYAIHHRSMEAQADLAVIKARGKLVQTRTSLVNCVRGFVKSAGERLDRCSPESFAQKARTQVPKELRPAVYPLLDSIEQLNEQIKTCERRITKLCEKYPETEVLQSIKGVGPITALTFVLVLEDPERFSNARDVAAYLGLTPKLSQSGNSDPQLRITKSGNALIRKLLVQCAQYILSRGDDSDLRRWGLSLAEKGGKRGKKRAVVAVARKLAVILFTLWRKQTEFNPFPNSKASEETEVAEAPAAGTNDHDEDAA